MQSYFIINAFAGGAGKKELTAERVREAGDGAGSAAEIYYSRYPGDGERFIKWMCACYPGETFRFFGCGGDGTLNEIVNGCAGLGNAVAGVLPTGTGNDFVRYFGDVARFRDIREQLAGYEMTMDLISCVYSENNRVRRRFCANMINIGFDSEVVVETGRIKKRGRLSGTPAYLAGVLRVLLRKSSTDLKIETEHGCVHDGPLLLTAVCNGRYCGGGVKNSPLSRIDDGLIDLHIINEVSRFRFLRFFPSYKKGTHLKKLTEKNILKSHTVRKVIITSNSGEMTVSNDGEIFHTRRLQLEVAPGIVRFSLPAGVKP